MSMSHIRLYDLFRKELHLPDDKASDFVVAVGEVSVWEADKNRQLLATKNDVHLLKEDIHSFRSEFKEDIQRLRSELKEDIQKLRIEFKEDIQNLRNEFKGDIQNLRNEFKKDTHALEIKIEQFKVDIYKAMFWTGLAQLLAILGGVLAIFKFMR